MYSSKRTTIVHSKMIMNQFSKECYNLERFLIKKQKTMKDELLPALLFSQVLKSRRFPFIASFTNFRLSCSFTRITPFLLIDILLKQHSRLVAILLDPRA